MTTMPIATQSDAWPIHVIGLGESPRVREGKFTPDGEATYTTGTVLMMIGADGATRAQEIRLRQRRERSCRV
ncbi:hypothetical protein HJ590_11310 [Naumannella sp. ID2617S]|nr:hypothetical protein [Naumannella sp. ID2617S]